MPNLCDYEMKILGRKSDRDEFVKRLLSYDEPNHFWRIFDADVRNEEGEKAEDYGATHLSGCCAWSLETCCRASGYSRRFGNGEDLFAVNTKELGLKLEAWAIEPGIGFEEHYIYDNGTCVEDGCLGIDVFEWDKEEYPTYEEFKADFPDAPPESEFRGDEYAEAYVGGYEDAYGTWSI